MKKRKKNWKIIIIVILAVIFLIGFLLYVLSRPWKAECLFGKDCALVYWNGDCRAMSVKGAEYIEKTNAIPLSYCIKDGFSAGCEGRKCVMKTKN